MSGHRESMAKVEPFKNIDSLWGNIWCGEEAPRGYCHGEEEMLEFSAGTQERKHQKLVRN